MNWRERWLPTAQARPGTPLLGAYAAVVVVVLVILGVTRAQHSVDEAVYNSSAVANVSDWQALSDGNVLRLSRVRVDGPGGRSTAVQVVRHGGRHGTWAIALARLRDPEHFLVKGRTYRMRAYIRDVDASDRGIGLVLANEHFSHQPTRAGQYGHFTDDSWHLLQRTFEASDDAAPDTQLYFELPPQGPLRVQITGASVQRVALPRPHPIIGPPEKVLSFAGSRGSSPDHQMWSHDVGGNGWGNDELQTYTPGTRNARLDGKGHLVITARREEATGVDGIHRHFTSARLTTLGKFSVRPGSYVEATIRAPLNPNVRPAFWLLGKEAPRVGWPQAGELDVFEATRESNALVRQGIHVSDASEPTRDAPYGEFAPGGFTMLPHSTVGDTHTYGVYFDDHLVQFYVDGKPRLMLTRAEAFESERAWPFDKPQAIVLSLAVSADASHAPLKARMEISSISIWTGGVPHYLPVMIH